MMKNSEQKHDDFKKATNAHSNNEEEQLVIDDNDSKSVSDDGLNGQLWNQSNQVNLGDSAIYIE